jgi:hypothetical protein
MSPAATATEIVFLPGFDGVAKLRAPFLEALARDHPARAIGYPNRTLETLNGYARFAASAVAADSRPVVIAESFSGLVAARWAAHDPHVAGLVLCASFARPPVAWAGLGASMPALAQFIGANFLNPMSFTVRDPARRRWSEALAAELASMRRDVIAERMRIIATEDVSGELDGLRIPIVLVHFDDDFLIGAAARGHLEAVCHNAEVVHAPGPHFAIETRPLEAAAAMRGPLAALFGRTASRPSPQ